MDAFVTALRDAMRPRRVPLLATIAAATLGVAVLAVTIPTSNPVVHAADPAPVEGPGDRYRRPELEQAAHAIQDSRLAEAEALLTEALGRPDPPLSAFDRADALYLLARLATFSGDDHLALERLESAYSRAVAADHARVAVDAASMLAGAHTERGQHEQGQRWLAQARAEVRRYGDTPTLMVTWLNTATGLELSVGRIDSALEKSQRAVALSDEPGVTTVARRISALRGLALALRAKGRLDQSESSMRRALELTEANQGPRTLPRAQILDQLAIIVAQQGRQDEGIALATQAVDIAREVHGAGSLATLQMQMNLAKHHVMAGDDETAVELLAGAIDTLAQTDPTSPVLDRARLDLATSLRRVGRLAEAREAATEALVGVETGGDHPPSEAERGRQELAAIDAASEAARQANGKTDVPPTDASR